MIRLMSVAAVLFTTMATASAGPLLTIVGTPASYTPGGSFSVSVLIEDVTDFASFSLDLKLSSSSGVAGTDFGFTPALLPPSSPDYVFDGNLYPVLIGAPGLFLQTPSIDGSNNAFLAVSDAFDSDGDFLTDGVTVPSGAPRLLAEATYLLRVVPGT